jgi:hypothetical protein
MMIIKKNGESIMQETFSSSPVFLLKPMSEGRRRLILESGTSTINSGLQRTPNSAVLMPAQSKTPDLISHPRF